MRKANNLAQAVLDRFGLILDTLFMDAKDKPAGNQAFAHIKPKKNGILFLEAGLFEIFFVFAGLLILFSTLNYFDILPISQSFPFLSFLPKKETEAVNKTRNFSLPSSPDLPTSSSPSAKIEQKTEKNINEIISPSSSSAQTPESSTSASP